MKINTETLQAFSVAFCHQSKMDTERQILGTYIIILRAQDKLEKLNYPSDEMDDLWLSMIVKNLLKQMEDKGHSFEPEREKNLKLMAEAAVKTIEDPDQYDMALCAALMLGFPSVKEQLECV